MTAAEYLGLTEQDAARAVAPVFARVAARLEQEAKDAKEAKAAEPVKKAS